MRILGRLVGLGFLVCACAATQGGLLPAEGGDKLYEAVSSQNGYVVSVIDSRSHAIERQLPLGAPSPDWKHLYSISGSLLFDTDPLTGAVVNTIPLPGRYQLPEATVTGMPGGTSPNGSWLVAESYDGLTGATPTVTHFVLIDTQASRVAHKVDLAGYFRFDAVSDDGLRLYLIQYLNGKEYYVRLYNVVSGSLDVNIVVDKSNGEQSMSGLRLSGIASPGGNWLFSMYVRENDNPFIHALSLDGPFAFCLDLPGAGYSTVAAEKRWSLAMNRAGTRLFAVNATTGIVAEVDTSSQFNPHVTRSAHLAAGDARQAGFAASVLSDDGRWLVAAGGSGIVWIDTATLMVRKQALGDWRVGSLALSSDGKSVYAVSESGGIAEVAIGGAEVLSRFDPGAGRPVALMRVASASGP